MGKKINSFASAPAFQLAVHMLLDTHAPPILAITWYIFFPLAPCIGRECHEDNISGTTCICWFWDFTRRSQSRLPLPCNIHSKEAGPASARCAPHNQQDHSTCIENRHNFSILTQGLLLILATKTVVYTEKFLFIL